jgi:hypothetical protein
MLAVNTLAGPTVFASKIAILANKIPIQHSCPPRACFRCDVSIPTPLSKPLIPVGFSKENYLLKIEIFKWQSYSHGADFHSH